MPIVYPTLQYPNDLLARPGNLVKSLDNSAVEIIENLFKTLSVQENCAALAATQLGVELRITVINYAVLVDGFISCNTADGKKTNSIDLAKEQPICLINPQIIDKSEDMVFEAEGCMSVGGMIREKIKRHKQVSCKFLSVENEELILVANGFLSRCIQHELDHLDGKLFIDRLSPLKRKMVDRKFLKRTR